VWAPVPLIVLSMFVLLPNPSARQVAGGLILGLQSFVLIAWAWRHRSTGDGRGLYFLSFGLGLLTLLFFLRALAAMSGSLPALDVSVPDNAQAATFLVAVVCVIQIALGLMVMSMEEREAAVRESRKFLQSTVDSVSTQMAVLDRDGRITATNAAWQRFLAIDDCDGQGCIGGNFLDCFGDGGVLASAQAANVREGITSVLNGLTPAYSTGYPVGAYWLSMTVTYLTTKAGGAVVARYDITELRRLQEELRQQASVDELTGAVNRRRFHEIAHGELLRAARFHQPLSLALVDLDYFKQINDRYGHAAGDHALRTLVDICRRNLREIDVLARLGGDEFVLLLIGTHAGQAQEALDRIRLSVNATSLDYGEHCFGFSISVGFTIAGSNDSLQGMLERADRGLYQAKEAGRNRVGHLLPDAINLADAEHREAILHLAWKPAYEAGIEHIDAEHRELFRLANLLMEQSVAESGGNTFPEAAKRLLDHVATHFTNEEAMLREHGYPDTDAHAAQHRQLLARAKSLFVGDGTRRPTLGEIASFFAIDVVALHMLQADRAFYPLLRDANSASASTPVA
jgi:diguanylate cyclase (GGDEF)-like protein/hemerythrin-like metal-binding protein